MHINKENTVTPKEEEKPRVGAFQKSLSLWLPVVKERHKKVSRCVRTRLGGRVQLSASRLSSPWCCCKTAASRTPAACPVTCATAGVGRWSRRVRCPRWAPCPPPGRSPRSAAAAGRWWGRAGQPSCGRCAAAGTSSSGPGTDRLSGGGETGHVRATGSRCVIVLTVVAMHPLIWNEFQNIDLFFLPHCQTDQILLPHFQKQRQTKKTTKLHLEFISLAAPACRQTEANLLQVCYQT